MSKEHHSSGGGVGFLGLLQLLFIGLKLGGVIDWSWWWVLWPTWVALATTALLLAVVVVFLLTERGPRYWK